MRRLILIVVAGLFLLSASSVMAQEPCTADFDCTQTVDADDVTEFLTQFGRSPFNNPCPDCYDSPCPCSATSSCIEIIPKTGQTTSYATGDDGDLQQGLIWPNPRFTDNGNGTVTDNLTWLIWLKDANCFGAQNWYNALSGCNGLASGPCGLTDGSQAGDWRLPNIKEQLSLIHWKYNTPAIPNTAGTGKWSSGDPFTNVQPNDCWTSTTHAGNIQRAKVLGLAAGNISGEDKTSTSNYFWPVRGGWVRFTDNGNGTVTDNNTNLVWLKDAYCFGEQNWDDAMSTAASLATGSCGLTDGSLAGYWRLPTKEE